MTRLAILASLVLTLPAAAQDTASWGGTGCTLVPVTGEEYVAVVNCTNRLTHYQPWTEGDMTAAGMTVHLSVLHGPAEIPDTFTITPPSGFVAVPPVLVLDEDTRGAVRVMPWLGF